MRSADVIRYAFFLVGMFGAESLAFAEATAEERAAAQVLFDQGKTLMQGRKFAEACPKFAESQRLDPRIATQFKLADCYEQLGMTASAWTNFLDVAVQTKAKGEKDREAVARKRADALEKKLSRLTVVVAPAARVEGLEIKRNGTAIGSGMWGTPIPVDPGEHTFLLSAPNKKDLEMTIKVDQGQREVKVEIPALEDAPPSPPEQSLPTGQTTAGKVPSSVVADIPPPVIRGAAQRTAGYTIGALGLASMGVGAFFGTQAQTRHDESLQNCRTPQFCSEKGLELNEDAKFAANVSTATFIAGGVLTATGILLVVLAPSSKPKSAPVAHLVPAFGPAFQGAFLTGEF